MVKNTIGGKKGKMLSKKQHSFQNNSFPISRDECEIYVGVSKIFGGGVFEVFDHNNIKYKAFLRGKMKGSNKRHNLVTINSILLVGIRSDFSEKFNVDILFVYDNHHIQTLSLHSNFNISLLNSFDSHNQKQPHDDNLIFNISNNNNHTNDTQNNTNTNTNTDNNQDLTTQTLDCDFYHI